MPFSQLHPAPFPYFYEYIQDMGGSPVFDDRDLLVEYLMNNGLESVIRYEGDRRLHPTLAISTGGHARSVLDIVADIFAGDPMLHDALAMAAGHDFGEIVVEPFAFGNMVNLAEKNGWHSLQVEAFFDTYERESRIAEYFLAQAYLALEAVRDGEGNSVQSFDQHKAWGIFSGKLKDARAYLDGREGMEAVERIAEYIQQNPLPPLAEDIQAKIATWMGYYARVEKHEDFYGAAVKRIEKVDGNLYYSDFSGVGDGIRLDGSLKTSKRIAKTAFPEYVDIPSGNHLKAIIRAEQGIAELFQMAANERETAIARKITALTYRTCSQNLEPAVEELEIEAAYPGTLTPVQKNRMEAQAKARSLYLEAAEAVEQGLFVPQKDAILGAELLKDAPELTR